MFSKIETAQGKVEAIFNRYVESTYPSKERAVQILMSGKELTFYVGIDPTGPDIHLGHTTNFLLLKKIMNLGHKIIVLIGDFTAQTGDPTGRDVARKSLTEKEVSQNAKTYLDQVHKLLPKGSFRVKYNSTWFNKMTLSEIRQLARQFTVQQMIARDMFQTRIKSQRPITLEEFLYPLMQGYDSVAMNVDGEIGGSDQTFNMLVGRDLEKTLLNKEKIVITTKLLEDPITGKKLMNKSEGQYIALGDTPEDMFGKIMALPDQAIIQIFTLATEISDQKIHEIENRLADGENPKIIKEELAFEMVKMYYGESAATKSKNEFNRVFSEGGLPEEIREFEIKKGNMDLSLVLKGWLNISTSESKRLIDQGAVTVNGKMIKEWNVAVGVGDIIKVGPRRFLKIT